MQTKSVACLFSFLSLLVVTVLQPIGASAGSVSMVGSVTITGAGGVALTTQLTGFAVVANPGLEKGITIQVPPFTFPVFVEGENADGSVGKLLKKNVDTTLVLTNTTAAALPIEVTLRDANGTVLSLTLESLAARATNVTFVSDLLP